MSKYWFYWYLLKLIRVAAIASVVTAGLGSAFGLLCRVFMIFFHLTYNLF